MAIAKYSPEYLCQLVSDPNSSVQLKKSSREILVQQWQLGSLRKAITSILNRSLCKYDSALDGLILGYQKLQQVGDTALCSSDSSDVPLRIQAEFYVFRPKIGNIYPGVVAKTSVSHIGCHLYNHFNVSLPILPQKKKFSTLTPNTEVTFRLEEFILASELPFFKGTLLGVKSNRTDQSLSKEEQKKMDLPKMSLTVKPKTSEKTKKDLQLTGVKSDYVADVLEKKSDRHSKLTLKRGDGSESSKTDKKKQRLSLKQSAEENKRETSDDDSDHLITPFQRPSENRRVNKPDEGKAQLDKKTLLSMRESPLRGLASDDDDLSDVSSDFLKTCKDKSSPNSQRSKSSQSKTRETGVNALRVDVQLKSPGGRNNEKLLPKNDSLSENEDKSSSDDSTELRKQPVLLQTPTKSKSSQKVKSTPTECLYKTKSKSPKTPKADRQSKSPGGKKSGAQTPVKNVPAIDCSSFEDEAKSSSAECKKSVSTSPLKGKSTPTESLPKIKSKSQKLDSVLSLSEPNVQFKSRSQSVSPLYHVPKSVDSSCEDDDKSSSDDSEEGRKLPHVSTKEVSLLRGSGDQLKSRKSESAAALDVQAKSCVVKNSGFQALAALKNITQVDVSSSEDDGKSSSEDSEDSWKKIEPVPTSPQKGKSTSLKVKAHSKKLVSALTLTKPDVKSRESQAVKSVPVANVLASEDDKSSPESSEDEARVVQRSPIRNMPLATSTQKSPLKKLPSPNLFEAKRAASSSEDSSDDEECRIPDSGATDKPGVSRPLPVVRCDSSSSDDSDSDTNDKRQKLERSRIVASAAAPQGAAKLAEESSSEDSDDDPRKKDEESNDSEVSKTRLVDCHSQRAIAPAKNSSSDSEADEPKTPAETRFQRPTATASDSSSDSEVEHFKTPAQTRPGDAQPRRLTASAEQSSSDSEVDMSKTVARTPVGHARQGRPTAWGSSTSQLLKDSSSDSESDEKTVAPSLVQRRSPTKPLPVKIDVQLPRKKSLLSQTYLDGSLQNRSPLACSTPTVESTKASHKNLFMQSLKRPYPAVSQDVVKTDEPLKKKEKSSKKLTDSGFEDLKEEKKKKKEDSKLSKEATKEKTKKEKQSHLESNATDPKKSKEKINVKTVTVTRSEPVKHGKHMEDCSKTKSGLQSLENLNDFEDLGKKKAKQVTSQVIDVTGLVQSEGGRKAKKRKLSERTDEGGRGSSMDPDLQKEELASKKRKLFSPTFDGSSSVVLPKAGKPALENLALKPKKSRKSKEEDQFTKPGEPGEQLNTQTRVTDDYNKGGIVSSIPVVSNKSTGSKQRVADLLREDISNRLSVDVRNPLSDDICDKKKKKKSKETDAVVTVKSDHDVILPLESSQKKRKGKDKVAEKEAGGKQTARAAHCEVGVRTAVDIQALSKPPTDLTSDSEKKLKMKNTASAVASELRGGEEPKSEKKSKKRDHFAVPAQEREPSPSLSVASSMYCKKKRTSESESEKKSKKKEKHLFAVPAPIPDPSPSLSVESSVSAKKKRTSESEFEKKSKKKEKHLFAIPTSIREPSPSLTGASIVSSKKNKTSEHMHTEEESKLKKKSKKKSKEKTSSIGPELTRELSPSLSVYSSASVKSKDSVGLKVSVTENKKKRKDKKKVEAPMGGTSIDLDDVLMSMIKETWKDLESEDDHKKSKK